MAVPGSGVNWSRATLSTADFQRAKNLIHAIAGISLAESRKVMVASRLAKRLRATGLDTYSDYLQRVDAAGSAERPYFVNALTTNLTGFFREAYHFPVMVDHVAQAAAAGQSVTLWSAGCSTGQEPYTMAIALREALGTQCPPLRIIASDIDTETLAFAERGVYPLAKLSGLTRAQIKRHFLCGSGKNEGLAIVRKEIRGMIDFRHINLSDSTWDVPGRLAAIFCRNVMIYFSKATQRHVLQRFAEHLASDGLLFVGHSENILYAAGDAYRSHGKTIYQASAGAKP